MQLFPWNEVMYGRKLSAAKYSSFCGKIFLLDTPGIYCRDYRTYKDNFKSQVDGVRQKIKKVPKKGFYSSDPMDLYMGGPTLE